MKLGCRNQASKGKIKSQKEETGRNWERLLTTVMLSIAAIFLLIKLVSQGGRVFDIIRAKGYCCIVLILLITMEKACRNRDEKLVGCSSTMFPLSANAKSMMTVVVINLHRYRLSSVSKFLRMDL